MNFTLTVASCISVIMPGDFKVVCIKQVFHFNSVHINEVLLFTYNMQVTCEGINKRIWKIQEFNIQSTCMFTKQKKKIWKVNSLCTVKPLYNGHIGPCKTGPYNEVASLLR